ATSEHEHIHDRGDGQRDAAAQRDQLLHGDCQRSEQPSGAGRPGRPHDCRADHAQGTNTAADEDLPANVLTYQLVSPPTGASIDSSGVITWTPSEAQGPSTNTFTTVVTDNGTP